MGYYINENSKGEFIGTVDKEKKLIEDGAVIIQEPKEWIEGLVCVVKNGLFDAAGYAYCESEMNYFKNPSDTRKKVWLYYIHAKELAK